MNKSDQSIAVLGGGICGLTTAYALNKDGFDVTIYEKNKTAGGKIQCFKKNNWLVERGPNTLMIKEKAIWNFLDDLNLSSSVIEANPQAQKRYIVRNSQLHSVPTSLLQFLTTNLLTTSAKLRLLKEPFVRPTPNTDETLASFVQRRLGKQPLHYGINPFVAGVYAGDPKTLSVRHTFSTLFEMEQTHGSIFKGMIKKERNRSTKKALISFKKGLWAIPERLQEMLEPSLKLETEVKEISEVKNGWKITATSAEQSTQTYSKVISTLPPVHLADIWKEPKSREAINKLSNIEYAPISVFALGFREDHVTHPLDGFGLLVPEKEDFNILGCLFSSTLFPNRAPKDHLLLTCFVGGMRQPKQAKKSAEKLRSIAMDDLTGLLGITGKPVFTQHTYYKQAIPQYNIRYDEFLDTAKQIENENSGFFVHGNFMGGVSVPDCITSSLEMAKRVAES